ncbi:MAG: GNAT family N-acetyltransferase [Fusobacteriaceae bacterium]
MQNLRVKKLETQRIEFKDWENIGFNFAEKLWGNKNVTEFLSSNGVFSESVIKQRYDLEVSNYKNFNIQYFPLFYKQSDEFIGCCGIKKYIGELGREKLIESSVVSYTDAELENLYEMGFHFLPEFWGKGLGEEAALKVIEYSFNTLKSKAIFAGHNPKNIRSAKLLKKLGFVLIGEEFFPPTGLMHPLYMLKQN